MKLISRPFSNLSISLFLCLCQVNSCSKCFLKLHIDSNLNSGIVDGIFILKHHASLAKIIHYNRQLSFNHITLPFLIIYATTIKCRKTLQRSSYYLVDNYHYDRFISKCYRYLAVWFFLLYAEKRDIGLLVLLLLPCLISPPNTRSASQTYFTTATKLNRNALFALCPDRCSC